jgi:hypothetical protein
LDGGVTCKTAWGRGFILAMNKPDGVERQVPCVSGSCLHLKISHMGITSGWSFGMGKVKSIPQRPIQAQSDDYKTLNLFFNLATAVHGQLRGELQCFIADISCTTG